MRRALVQAPPRVLRALELPALLAVPVVMVATAAAGLDVTAGLTLAVAVLAVGLLFASFEASRPPLRQLMPTAVLAATAAAGRVLFAPIPDVKPVSAIAIVAGAPLDIVHGIATAGFLAVIWLPWGRAIRRVVAKYDFAAR